MATLTLKPGPCLLYLPEYDKRDLDRLYTEDGAHLPSESTVTRSAHRYLFETMHVIDNPSIGDFVLLADGNPYLLGTYERYNAVDLVIQALQLREKSAAGIETGEYLQVFRNEYGLIDFSLMVTNPARRQIVEDEWVEDFFYAHSLPVVFESNTITAPGDEAKCGLPLCVREPTLGEVLALFFGYFQVKAVTLDDLVPDNCLYGDPNDYDDYGSDYDEEGFLSDYDAETDLIRAELDEYAEQYSQND